jgi:hypothetical protein
LWTSSAVLAGAGASCPRHEAGARYPWQSNRIMRGDRFAWVHLDVDRNGYPFRCMIGQNNFPDPEMGVWLCKSYTDRWRTSAAATSEPATRRMKRYSLIAGYDHHIADRKARRLWFKQNPSERPECYPEPIRPDRLG